MSHFAARTAWDTTDGARRRRTYARWLQTHSSRLWTWDTRWRRIRAGRRPDAVMFLLLQLRAGSRFQRDLPLRISGKSATSTGPTPRFWFRSFSSMHNSPLPARNYEVGLNV